MGALIVLALLAVAALFGLETFTRDMPVESANATPAVAQETVTRTASSTRGMASIVTTTGSTSSVLHTVAVTDDAKLPAVNVAPDAPRAAPIDPIVAPVKRVPVATGKAAKKPAKADSNTTAAGHHRAAKTKSANSKPAAAGSKSGVKLVCTSTQKVDTARNKCVPAKGKATASVKTPKT